MNTAHSNRLGHGPILSRRKLAAAVSAGALGGLLEPLFREAGLLAAERKDETSVVAKSGLDPQKVFQRAVNEAIESGELGMQIAVYKDGKSVVDVWGGHIDEAKAKPLQRDTLMNVYSVTKAWTNVALQIQAERGLVDYNKPVAHYWPEFAANGKGKCTVRDALAHRAGLPLMPPDVTPEKMADYDWMVKQMAAMKPLYEPGTTNAYHSYTWGWLISEIVRRTDAKRRPFGQFVQDEICKPLGTKDMWMGIPKAVEPRVSPLYGKGSSSGSDNQLMIKSMPIQVETSPEVWSLPFVRAACIPGAGGISCASEHVKFWAMLANGGELNGVRLLSADRIRGCSLPRHDTDKKDLVLDRVLNISSLGFWLRGSGPVVGTSPHILAQTGAGNNIGWADPDNNLAVTIGHNRFGSAYNEPLANAVTRAFGIA